jgi:hypothetical protein
MKLGRFWEPEPFDFGLDSNGRHRPRVEVSWRRRRRYRRARVAAWLRSLHHMGRGW